MSTNIFFASVGRRTDWPRVQHHTGLPPELAESEVDERETLPWPHVVLLEEAEDTAVTLTRFAANGSFAGDTWHLTLEEAKEQAAFEYDEALGEWQEVPQGTADPVAYALKHAS